MLRRSPTPLSSSFLVSAVSSAARADRARAAALRRNPLHLRPCWRPAAVPLLRPKPPAFEGEVDDYASQERSAGDSATSNAQHPTN
jgi:hypothetical protein